MPQQSREATAGNNNYDMRMIPVRYKLYDYHVRRIKIGSLRLNYLVLWKLSFDSLITCYATAVS